MYNNGYLYFLFHTLAEAREVNPRSSSNKDTQFELAVENLPVQNIVDDFVEKVIEPQLRHVNTREDEQG